MCLCPPFPPPQQKDPPPPHQPGPAQVFCCCCCCYCCLFAAAAEGFCKAPTDVLDCNKRSVYKVALDGPEKQELLVDTSQ